MRRVGVPMGRAESDLEGQRQAAAFREGLAALSWVPGRNVTVDYRWHAGETARADAYAKELIELSPDVLVANTTPSLAAMYKQTSTIPIIFIGVADPVGQGFVPSLAHPGGNITGFGLEEPSMGARWVELLNDVRPGGTRPTILFNPATAPFARTFLPSVELAAKSAGLTMRVAEVRTTQKSRTLSWQPLGSKVLALSSCPTPSCLAVAIGSLNLQTSTRRPQCTLIARA